MTMDPTTLVTFLFGAPPEVRTVELLGSWDNFERPYQMHHDRRRGFGFWSGCFKFENITFDGDDLVQTKPRSGGLKQGGVYWYFYRLNYDIDVHDHRQPSTTFCPLLPGQPVNVIEVPLEIVEPPTRCQSAYGEIIGSLSNWNDPQTLDPANKYAMLEPPPKSKVHGYCLSDDALNGRLENQPVIVVQDTVSPLGSACSERALDHDTNREFPERNDVSRASSVYSRGSFDSGPPSQAAKDDTLLSPPPAPQTLAPLPSLEQITASMFSSHYHARSDSGLAVIQPSKKKSEMSIGPTSIQNVQFYGSRPGTSLNDDPGQYRPRTYSVPNSVELSPSPQASPPKSPASCAAHEPVILRCSNLDPAPETGDAEFDFQFASPSLSASTASSDDGHARNVASPETPELLAERPQPQSQDALPQPQLPPPAVPASRPSTDVRPLTASRRPSTASRFASLRNRFRHRVSPSEPPPPLPTTRPAAFAMNYSLPALAVESNNSSTKTLPNAVPHHATDVPPLPLVIPNNVEAASPEIYSPGRSEGENLAEAILAEMGF